MSTPAKAAHTLTYCPTCGNEYHSVNNPRECRRIAKATEVHDELVAACREIVAYYAKYPDKYWLNGALKARKAIARAEGREA